MTLDSLVEDAGALALVPAAAAAEYDARRDAMAARVNAEFALRRDTQALIGGGPLEVMHENHANHAAFMATVFALGQQELLARTLPWVYRAYRGRGFSYDYFPIELAAWVRAVEECLPPGTTSEVVATYRWMMRRHDDIVRLAEAGSERGGAHARADGDRWAEPLTRYVAALLEGDSGKALEVAKAVTTPQDLEGFYLQVVQPAMYQVGARWEAGQMSVAEEHLASAITARVVAGLTSARGASKPWRGRAVVSAAPSEFHELGAWILSDLLEVDGWEVSYLGANTPQQALVDLVRRREPAFVALSVTMPFNLEKTKTMIASLRAQNFAWPLRVIVGGAVFNLQHGLWAAIGADAFAEDAQAAVTQVRAFGEAAMG
jgi:methanogenic corrinoid protein MtbC1